MHKDLYLQGLNKRYNLAKKECIGFYNANKKLQHENHALKDMLNVIWSSSYRHQIFGDKKARN